MTLLIVFGMILPWLLVAVFCWLGYQLVLQNGRILLRLRALEERLAGPVPAPAPPAGLPIGSAAPEFELPDLAGEPQTLSQFRGRPVLLVFFNPQCGFCVQMLSDLAELPADGADGRPVPVVVTTGSAEENRQLVEEHSVRCLVLLQKQMEVASQYQSYGTPSGYLIDAQGHIASPQAVGAEPLLALAQEAAPEAPAANGQKRPRGKANRGLHTSKINRNGLKAGTSAPDFRLPRLDGGELSLDEYRGRRVLLVFSDPECGPCDQLAPQLEQIHRQKKDLQVILIGRRGAEANRRKVQQHGLTFPVVLQQQWEISRLYGMFAMPIGYLIDEQGVLASGVAVGPEAVLALASGTAVPDAAGAPAGA